jgi:hypothetical protein
MEQAWFGDVAMQVAAKGVNQIDEKTYANQFLREVVSHEMGHIMGLRHNFIASTNLTLDQLKDEKNIEEQGISASVMDYIPFNISALKSKGVSYYQPGIGLYDYWAIQYGYTPIDAKTPEDERNGLSQIASQCNAPGHLYQSDEIADQFDPAVVRFDLSHDPLGYWARMLELSRGLLLNLGQREPKNGASYWEFTRDLNRLLGEYSRAAAVSARYIGGLHVNRNFKGDPGEKPTLAPIDGAQQKRALRLLTTYIFSENAFTMPRSYYTNLTTDPNASFIETLLGGLPQDVPIRDQIAGVQNAALRYCFSPGVLSRVVNNEFKVGDPSQALTLPTLYSTLRTAVWSELPARKNIGTLHRQLQRTYLDTMIRMVISSPGGVPEDAKMLAWNDLRQLKAGILAAQKESYDDYTRIHLDESLARINRALDAKLMIGSGAPAMSISLLDLLGGEKPAPSNK